MDPPEPEQLVASLGGNLSANTREAIEAAPAQLALRAYPRQPGVHGALASAA